VEVVLSAGTPPGVIPDVKQAIIDYANASLFNAEVESFDRTGFDIGETVPAGKLYTPVNSVVGLSGYVESIQLGTSPSDINYPTISPGTNGVVVFESASIDVEIST
jgi:hypothetical protein